ncbi:hypothetical protein ScalyP_jg12083, partial [Parmales sp. scaly parma]
MISRSIVLSHPSPILPTHTITLLLRLCTSPTDHVTTVVPPPSSSPPTPTTLTITTSTLSLAKTTLTYVGLGPVLQALSARSEPGSMLSGDGSLAHGALCEGWVGSCLNELGNGGACMEANRAFRRAVDQHLELRTCLVGECFTYADLFVRECCGNLRGVGAGGAGAGAGAGGEEKELSNLRRWCETVDGIFGQFQEEEEEEEVQEKEKGKEKEKEKE